MILQAFSLSIHSATKTVLKIAGIYRWSIILADTDFFQQSVSVSAANFRGRNNRPSTFLSNKIPKFIKNSAKVHSSP